MSRQFGKETIYNLFAYSDGKLITALGLRPYVIADGVSDAEKFEFLKSRCNGDHEDAIKAQVMSPTFTVSEYLAKHRLGTALHLFEELFRHVEAPASPLFLMTTIVNGEARVDHSYSGALDPNDISGPGKMDDYLTKYTSGESIDFMRMFDDDYFKAIKLLFNGGFFVSSTKLLMIFIDTAAFVEHGDVQGNFQSWLRTFVPLRDVNVDPAELWEFRNGVLHMSNLHSRAVLSGKVMRLVPCVDFGDTVVDPERNEKRFDLLRLISAIASGVGSWMQTYNDDRSKFDKFVERYDTVVSDSRTAYSPK